MERPHKYKYSKIQELYEYGYDDDNDYFILRNIKPIGNYLVLTILFLLNITLFI